MRRWHGRRLRRLPRTRSGLAALAAALLLATVLTACTGGDSAPREKIAAQAFLDAVGRGDAAKAGAATTDQTAAIAVVREFTAALGVGQPHGAQGRFAVTAITGATDTAATAEYSATWTMPGAAQPWIYSGELPMSRPDGAGPWKVLWSANVLHPRLATGASIAVARTQPPRASLADAEGNDLFVMTGVVTVGMVPNQVTDLIGESQVLAEALGLSAQDIVDDVSAALPTRPDDFIEIVTVRRTDYQMVRDAIYELPGVQFRTSERLLAPSAGFARQLLGTVGPATAELIADSNGRVAAGDQTGLSGLQRALDTQLAGTPGLEVQLINPDGTDGGPLGSFGSPKPGHTVQLTLDRTLQVAADGALTGIEQQASLVVVQPSTGRILAVANSPSAAGNIALQGQYAPGSTFKIATATAALADGGRTPASPVSCPGTLTVDGRVYENQDRFDLGAVDLRTAFANSCNTTFIELGTSLPESALPDAAAALGLGDTVDWSLPVDAFSGSVPEPDSRTREAENAIGQGNVLMSPLAMAMAVAAVQSGRPVGPSLVVGEQRQPGPALPGATVEALRDMMRAVVTSGTASQLAELPGEVAGKTGTAEYGVESPPRAHSWFVGFRGDLAFAVFVADGKSAGAPAVPIARTFLEAVPL
jgi:cell division protein FtsI/penicillin-binding protein 2